jgi:hypothetical protein
MPVDRNWPRVLIWPYLGVARRNYLDRKLSVEIYSRQD